MVNIFSKTNTQIKFFLFLLVAMLFCTIGNGQIDSSFIEVIPDKKIIAPHLTLRKFRLAFSTAVSEEITVQNHNLSVGVRLKREKIGISLAIPIATYGASTFGQPKAFGFGFHIYPATYYLQGTVNYFVGFDNLNALDNDPQNVFRPNDRMLFVNTTIHYAFNHQRYSLRSAFKMINRQKRSAGSWVLAIPINYQYFTSDGLRLPLRDQADFELDLYRSFKLGGSGGYAYSQVWGNWSANALITGGIEFRTLAYRNLTTRNIRNQFLISPRLQTTLSLVYNTKKFFGGLVGWYLPGVDIADGLNTRVENWTVRLMIGRRL